MAEWHTTTTARVGWADAPKVDSAELLDLVVSAQVQCGIFAGLFTQEQADAAEMSDTPEAALKALAPRVPTRVREAHYLQIQALWTRKQTGGADMYGGEGFTVREYDMSTRIRRLLRPEDGKARVG